MGIAVYSVVRRDGSWRVLINARVYGSFPSRAAATKIAIDTADLAGRHNAAGAVVVSAQPGAADRVIWTYGTDTVPTTFE